MINQLLLTIFTLLSPTPYYNCFELSVLAVVWLINTCECQWRCHPLVFGFGKKEEKWEEKNEEKHRTWVKSWILQRQAHGGFPSRSRNFLFQKFFSQLFPIHVHMLKKFISPVIQRQKTNYRDCISLGKKPIRALGSPKASAADSTC